VVRGAAGTSDYKRVIEVNSWSDSVNLDIPGVRLAQPVNPKTIGLVVNDLEKTKKERFQLNVSERAFENGLLNPLTMRHAQLSNLAESALAGGGVGGNVVGD